jgi:hypothetical protein
MSLLLLLLSPLVSAGECQLNSDCPESYSCVEGTCEADDGFVQTCPDDEVLDAETGLCFEPECEQDSDCGLGLVCFLSRCETDTDADSDRDGVPDTEDNCADDNNADQRDTDLDGLGDVCDDDDDNDGIDDVDDTCPRLPSPDTDADTDGDGQGDLCDFDDDGDGLLDVVDLCPLHADAFEQDSDSDGIGDACDLCPYDAAAAHVDPDGDGFGNECDEDDDGDCVPDTEDNCPTWPNEDQEDSDGDGRGDACDEYLLESSCLLEDALDILSAEACCATSTSPGTCGEDTCLVAVCDADPYCCETAWDSYCEAAAEETFTDECSCAFDITDITNANLSNASAVP